MATSEVDILTTVWTRITAAGQSGSCWKKTNGQMVVDHTDQETADTLPLSSTSVTVGTSKRVPLDRDNDNALGIAADSPFDVYYALSIVGPSKIVVDVI